MWPRADMAAVGELVLVLGLLVSAHCEVRARDPGEEEEGELGGRAVAGGGGGGGGVAFPSHLEELPPGATENPPVGEKGNYPARMGNWCAFVQKRVVTTAIACGTEKYTIRSQSPCPIGTPDCQLVMYKLSTRPVYRQKQQIFTALLWQCCPGHGGQDCEDSVSDAQLNPEKTDVIEVSEEARPRPGPSGGVMAKLHSGILKGVQEKFQRQHGDPDREQNDHQAPLSSLYDASYTGNQHNITDPARDTGHAHTLHHVPQHTANMHNPHLNHDHHVNHPHHGQQQGRHPPEYPVPVAYQEVPAALPVPHMMALVMSQLQPLLEGFNRSLDHLSRQVGDLARDVAQLKSSQLGAELQAEPPDFSELDAAAEERLNTRLDETLQQVREVRRQVESQRTDIENRLHSQHAMLHYNLTSFKTDIDMKLKRNQKMLQVSLQAMNSTLAEMKLEQAAEDQLEDHISTTTVPPSRPLQPSDTGLWGAIERLDNMVVSNTEKVDGMMEDLEVTSGYVQQLRGDLKDLGKQLNATARTSQIQFMETGLEVELAREVVLRRVDELAGNLSVQSVRMQDLDLDMDYLYTIHYKRNCSLDCKGIKVALADLEKGLANVTKLANENQLALDESDGAGAGEWGGPGDWEPAVATLQQDLQQVQETLTSEKTRTSVLEQSLSQLSNSVTVGLAEVSGLRKLVEEMKHLPTSFNSLLKDAIRHSDVLELLLGEEVLEFLEWPVQDQEAHSIPALKEQLSLLQEQLSGHSLSITSLLGNKPESREEVPSADQPPSSPHHFPEDWLSGSRRRSTSGVPARERQLVLHPQGGHPEHGVDGSDLWNLEKTVKELRQKVLLLEEEQRNATIGRAAPPSGVEAKLQAEVLWLKRGLEEHLKVFKNVFSNADVLAGSKDTLALDKLLQLVKNREGKKDKKRGGGREGTGSGGHHRSRRETSGIVPLLSRQSDDPLLLVAGSPLRGSNSVILLEPSLNRGQFYSDTGTFMAPVKGIYLFVLTLDLRPGPAHMVLRKGLGGAMVSLHRQEGREAGLVTGVSLLLLSEGDEVRLELQGGEWVESVDNVFTALLLHRTT
ncbi:multimerin-2a [Notolabrus celidotus]|uniref:multimerin-2a n=1 Tax=Notolabrus celidotus TaxID=1203425 RepID=UPI00149001BC|nr:multimerin-2a [Notolabrus celidotus]